MSDKDMPGQEMPRPQLVARDDHAEGDDSDGAGEQIPDSAELQEPAKVMRIGSMIKQLLEEVRSIDLDEPARERLREIYDLSVNELSVALPDELGDELERLTLPFADDDTPSGAELIVAKAQLVGWLEGLFHGIQATLFAQQMAARQQLQQMRHQIGPGSQNPPVPDRPGTYL